MKKAMKNESILDFQKMALLFVKFSPHSNPRQHISSAIKHEKKNANLKL